MNMNVKPPNLTQGRLFGVLLARMEQLGGNPAELLGCEWLPVTAPDGDIQRTVRAPLFGEAPGIPETPSIRDMRLFKLLSLPAAQKVVLAEQLFDEADALYASVLERFGAAEGEEGIQAVRELLDKELEWFRAAEEAMIASVPHDIYSLFLEYRTSFQQVFSTLRSVRTSLITDPEGAALLYEQLCKPAQANVLLDGKGYRTSRSREELARYVALTFAKNALRSTWDGKLLVMTMSDEIRDSWRCEDILALIDWPPNPQDPVLQAFQRILGWTFDIDVSSEHVVVTVNFGESYFESESS